MSIARLQTQRVYATNLHRFKNHCNLNLIMYFSIGPKEKLKDFFNYKEEYTHIIDALKRGEKLIAIQGVRIVGKTSLMNILFNELKGINTWADGRVIEKSKDLLDILAEGIKNKGGIFGSIKSIGISIAGVGVTAERTFSEEKIRKAKKVNLFIDEAQYAVKEEISKALSYVYDRFPNVRMIISGSEVRIIDEVLAVENPSSPLFGRKIELIRMKRLIPEKSKEFLRLGFDEIEISISDREIEEAVRRLDGLMGWLTLYGYERGISGSKDALEKVEGIALSLVREELKNFLKGKKNKNLYIAILKYANKRRWKELLSVVRDELRKVNSTSFSRAIKELLSYSFLEKEGEFYFQADPMIRETAFRF